MMRIKRGTTNGALNGIPATDNQRLPNQKKTVDNENAPQSENSTLLSRPLERLTSHP
jgi:hypothetical protein